MAEKKESPDYMLLQSPTPFLNYESILNILLQEITCNFEDIPLYLFTLMPVCLLHIVKVIYLL